MGANHVGMIGIPAGGLLALLLVIGVGSKVPLLHSVLLWGALFLGLLQAQLRTSSEGAPALRMGLLAFGFTGFLVTGLHRMGGAVETDGTLDRIVTWTGKRNVTQYRLEMHTDRDPHLVLDYGPAVPPAKEGQKIKVLLQTLFYTDVYWVSFGP